MNSQDTPRAKAEETGSTVTGNGRDSVDTGKLLGLDVAGGSSSSEVGTAALGRMQAFVNDERSRGHANVSGNRNDTSDGRYLMARAEMQAPATSAPPDFSQLSQRDSFRIELTGDETYPPTSKVIHDIWQKAIDHSHKRTATNTIINLLPMMQQNAEQRWGDVRKFVNDNADWLRQQAVDVTAPDGSTKKVSAYDFIDLKGLEDASKKFSVEGLPQNLLRLELLQKRLEIALKDKLSGGRLPTPLLSDEMEALLKSVKKLGTDQTSLALDTLIESKWDANPRHDPSQRITPDEFNYVNSATYNHLANFFMDDATRAKFLEAEKGKRGPSGISWVARKDDDRSLYNSGNGEVYKDEVASGTLRDAYDQAQLALSNAKLLNPDQTVRTDREKREEAIALAAAAPKPVPPPPARRQVSPTAGGVPRQDPKDMTWFERAQAMGGEYPLLFWGSGAVISGVAIRAMTGVNPVKAVGQAAKWGAKTAVSVGSMVRPDKFAPLRTTLWENTATWRAFGPRQQDDKPVNDPRESEKMAYMRGVVDKLEDNIEGNAILATAYKKGQTVADLQAVQTELNRNEYKKTFVIEKVVTKGQADLEITDKNNVTTSTHAEFANRIELNPLTQGGYKIIPGSLKDPVKKNVYDKSAAGAAFLERAKTELANVIAAGNSHNLTAQQIMQRVGEPREGGSVDIASETKRERDLNTKTQKPGWLARVFGRGAILGAALLGGEEAEATTSRIPIGLQDMATSQPFEDSAHGIGARAPIEVASSAESVSTRETSIARVTAESDAARIGAGRGASRISVTEMRSYVKECEAQLAAQRAKLPERAGTERTDSELNRQEFDRLKTDLERPNMRGTTLARLNERLKAGNTGAAGTALGALILFGMALEQSAAYQRQETPQPRAEIKF